jgi:hypothetical protein
MGFRVGFQADEDDPGLTTEYTNTATRPTTPKVNSTIIALHGIVLGVATKVTLAS